ncbi:hypothetical protein [Yoonia sp.]
MQKTNLIGRRMVALQRYHLQTGIILARSGDTERILRYLKLVILR